MDATAIERRCGRGSLGRLKSRQQRREVRLRGLWRRSRRACAWATLCVAPYFAYGTTEVIANPAVRNVAGAILFTSLAWFVSLVYCLRVSRPASPARPPGQDASAG